MEKGKEDRVGWVSGDMLEMHAGELGGGEEGNLARMLQTAGVWRDDAIGGRHGRAESNYEASDKRKVQIAIRPRTPHIWSSIIPTP